MGLIDTIAEKVPFAVGIKGLRGLRFQGLSVQEGSLADRILNGEVLLLLKPLFLLPLRSRNTKAG